MVCKLSTNDFWKRIGCVFSPPCFGVEGQNLWVNDDSSQKISGHKRKRKCRNICFGGVIFLVFVNNMLLVLFQSILLLCLN